MDQRISRPPVWSCILIIVGSALGAFAFLTLFTFWQGSPIQSSLMEAHGAVLVKPTNPITESQITQINELMRGGTVLSADQFLDHTTSFYETLISILVTLLGLVAGIAYMYIKSVSVESAKDQARKYSIESLESDKFRSVLNEKLSPHLTPLNDISDTHLALQDLEDISDRMPEAERRIASLQDQVRALANVISSQDETEDSYSSSTLLESDDSVGDSSQVR